MQSKRHALEPKESQVLEIPNSLEGQVALLGAEPHNTQAQLADLTLQCDGWSEYANTLLAKRDVAAGCEATEIRNLQAPKISRLARFLDVNTARHRAYQMEASLINLYTEVHGCI